jgi:exopolysaccharide production protein ExoZ
MNRIDSLDWQRGLLACAIMAYHLTVWQLYQPDSASLLGRLGLYAVSMFFILSGLSMALVYNRFICSFRSSLKFFIRRIFRIWPLLWLAVAFSAGSKIATGMPLDWTVVLSNLSTAFAFTNPSGYMNTGAWSLGNEMVYYAMTPLIIHAYNKRLLYGNTLTGLACLVGVVFATRILTPDQTLHVQWSQYINPFNNLFLYCAGIALFYNAGEWRCSRRANVLCLAVALGLFVFYPIHGDQIHIVTGVGRLVFCCASLLLVLAFYKNTFSLPVIASARLTELGLVTYGVYLLHPLVYSSLLVVSKKLEAQPSPSTLIGSTVVLTLILAATAFNLLEEPLIRLGKRLTSGPAVKHAGTGISADGKTPQKTD